MGVGNSQDFGISGDPRTITVQLLRSKNQVAKTVTGRSTSVNVQKYLLSSPVLVYVYISFENVRVVNETVNLWCVFWKNYISFSFYSVRQLTIFLHHIYI